MPTRGHLLVCVKKKSEVVVERARKERWYSKIPSPRLTSRRVRILWDLLACHLWIPNYAELTKPHTVSPKVPHLSAGQNRMEAIFKLLNSSAAWPPVRGVAPCHKKPFLLYVDEKQGESKRGADATFGDLGNPQAGHASA